jgi:hypothetical protein
MSGHVTEIMNSAWAGMSPLLPDFGLKAMMAITKQKTNAISMLNNMS